MACSIDYIEKANISNTEKQRLNSLHVQIFSEAKQSKAFRSYEGKLYTLKNDYNKGLQFKNSINEEHEQEIAKLVSPQPGQFYLSVDVLPLAAEKQTELFLQEGTIGSTPSKEIIEKTKTLIEKMGVSIKDLSEYAKAEGFDTTSTAAIADSIKGVIAIAEGKETALTEEMVHIATQIIEQTNPNMITEMISKIERFGIYKKVFEQYSKNKYYRLANGKPDIRKIKKEAVDKLITELIVNNNENNELLKEEDISLVRKWWNTILDWIRGLYKKANIDIFETAKEIILNEDIGTVENIVKKEIFFQLTDKQKEIQDKILKTRESVRKTSEEVKTEPVLADSDESSNFYEVKNEQGEWIKVKKRVTDRVKQWYSELPQFRGKIFTKEQKAAFEVLRKYGLEGHADLEEIHSRYYNEDGTKKDFVEKRPEEINLPTEGMYQLLENYYVSLIEQFPKDTLVFSEAIIYDPKEKEAGTIDFLAVEPSGKTHILDWKFMNIKGEDVAWYKRGAFNIQIGRYKDILSKEYGIKDFGMKRAIPIAMELNKTDKLSGDKVLTGIAIGSVDVNKIKELKLLPVPEETESTGYEALDDIIRQLNGLLEQIGKEKATTEEEKQFKKKRLNVLGEAIRRVQVTQNLTPLVQVIEVMRKEGDQILNDYNAHYKDLKPNSQDVSDSNLSDFAEEMNDFLALSKIFSDITIKLGDLIYKEGDGDILDEAQIELRSKLKKKLEDESQAIRELQESVFKASRSFADKHIGERNLVVGMLNPEPILKGLASIFRGSSDLGLKAIDILIKLTRTTQGKAQEDALREIQNLVKIRDKLAKKSVDLRKYIHQIYKKDEGGKLVNHLIDKYSPEFRETVNKKAEDGGDRKWLLDNIDLEGYKKEADALIDRLVKQVKTYDYSGDELSVELQIDNEIRKVKQQYDITRQDFNGWNNYIIKRHPAKKWYSEEYKNVEKDPDLFELYNFVVKFNEKAKEIGFIDNQIVSSFLPFVRKSVAEKLVWDNTLSVMDNFRRSLQINPEDTGYGSINKVTKEYENAIPKYYTYDFTLKKTEEGEYTHDYSDVSEDLFKNLILYIQQVEKYKYLSDIEGQLKLVRTIEKHKSHLKTSREGNVIREGGKLVIEDGNSENFKTFDDFLRTILYEQKYVLSDSDTPLHIDKVLNTIKRGINKLAGKEIWKENEEPKHTSLNKSIDALNRGFQLKTLGFEFISGAVNMFGGNIQVATQAGNYFNLGDFVKNESKIISQDFGNSTEKEMFVQLVNTFMPLREDPAYQLYKDSGMNVLTRQNLGDILMVFMRKPEQWIEKSVFMSLLDNSMVVDGKIVNIREYVKSKNKDRYKSASSYKDSKAKIEAEIEELKKTKSISATKKLVDGKLEIPGLDLSNRKELQRLTNLSKTIAQNATGNMTHDNINKMSMSIWTKSMMVFKNWIPKLADTRFSEFRRVSDDFSVTIEDGLVTGQKYDIGRIRLLGYFFSLNLAKTIKDLKDILVVNEAGILKLDEMFLEFKDKYEKRTGEELRMTPDEFKDMIRNNIRNQLRELAILAGLMGIMLGMGYMAPDDDDDRATKNFYRYSQKVIDKFVSELSFFYNPVELQSILSGGMFPAIGLINDFFRFNKHFWLETTGLDMDPNTSFEDVKKKAQPIKALMRMAPITKSAVTYISLFDEQWARDFDVTVQKENR